MPDRSPAGADRRVFGIGLNKTATTSFHQAVSVLGWRSLHWGGPAIRRAVEAALATGRPLLEDLDPTLEAFSDVEPLYRNFDVVDAQYPGSRFVLTVRPVDSWLDSRRRHVLRNQRRRATGEYQGSFLVVDEKAWRSEWETHLDRVRRHFAGRDDLLEIDLTRNPGWTALCRFLSVPEPSVPFPWENRDADDPDLA